LQKHKEKFEYNSYFESPILDDDQDGACKFIRRYCSAVGSGMRRRGWGEGGREQISPRRGLRRGSGSGFENAPMRRQLEIHGPVSPLQRAAFCVLRDAHGNAK